MGPHVFFLPSLWVSLLVLGHFSIRSHLPFPVRSAPHSFFHPRTQCWSDLSPFTPRSWPQSIHSRVSFTPPNQGLSSLLAIDLFLVLERVHLLGNMSNENWDGPCSVLAQPLGVFLTLDCGDSGGGGGVRTHSDTFPICPSSCVMLFCHTHTPPAFSGRDSLVLCSCLP